MKTYKQQKNIFYKKNAIKQYSFAYKNLIIKTICGYNNEGISRNIRMCHQPR